MLQVCAIARILPLPLLLLLPDKLTQIEEKQREDEESTKSETVANCKPSNGLSTKDSLASKA